MRTRFMMGGARICYAPDGEGTSSGVSMGMPAPQGIQPMPPSQQQVPDNQQGNLQPAAGTFPNQNNTGTGFDPASFWNEPVAAPPGSPAAGSADSTNGAATGQQVGQEFANRLASMDFGAPAFNADVVAQLSEGKLDGINTNMTQIARNAVQQSVVMSAQLMVKHAENLMARVDQMIEAKLGGRDNNDTLLASFPSARDPAIRPVVEQIFNQSLKLARGDRTAAVEHTKMMLRHMGTKGADDLGIPPANPSSDNYSSPGTQSLLDDLLGRT